MKVIECTCESAAYRKADVAFEITKVGYDLGDIICHGPTVESAIENYKDMWMCKHDEEIEVKIVNE